MLRKLKNIEGHSDGPFLWTFMYSGSRRYRKNDWWDFVEVIEQELTRDPSAQTYYNIFDELKWRIVESISEGGNFKIRMKTEELKLRFEGENFEENQLLTEINAIISFIL